MTRPICPSEASLVKVCVSGSLNTPEASQCKRISIRTVSVPAGKHYVNSHKTTSLSLASTRLAWRYLAGLLRVFPGPLGILLILLCRSSGSLLCLCLVLQARRSYAKTPCTSWNRLCLGPQNLCLTLQSKAYKACSRFSSPTPVGQALKPLFPLGSTMWQMVVPVSSPALRASPGACAPLAARASHWPVGPLQLHHWRLLPQTPATAAD